YGEANILFLTRRKWILTVFRFLSGGVMVMIGTLASLDVVWSFGEICMAILTLCNLIAILLLGKYAFRLLKDNRTQKKNGIKSPVFYSSKFPEISKDLDAWGPDDE
ncbi:MAG: alanine:cation symporter family protein, partial [Muribaculaceae bacterium]|nr:alanine:cation symporter family protein [Muribaculaceae bacterium]